MEFQFRLSLLQNPSFHDTLLTFKVRTIECLLCAQGTFFLTTILKLGIITCKRGFPGSSVVKNLPTNAGDTRDPGSTLVGEDSLEEEMATHSSILAWKIPWTEEPGRLQSIGLQRFGHNRAQNTNTHKNQSGKAKRHDQVKISELSEPDL